MPRKLRIEFEGAIYHLMNRGDRREPILFGEMRRPRDSTAGRREFERQMEARRWQPGDGEEWAAIRRGWFFGDEALKQELLARGVRASGGPAL